VTSAERALRDDHQANLESAAPQRIRALLRRARSVLLRPRLPFEAAPGNDVKKVGEGEWESTGSAPSFELASKRGRFPIGFARVLFELDSDEPFVRPPAIYLDTGAGYTEGNRLFLPRPRGGVIDALINFPPRIRAMRFTPIDRRGSFRMGKLAAQEIGRLEAGARSLTPILREILADPGRPMLALKKTWMALREGGPSGLMQRIRDRTRLNDGYAKWIAQFDTLSADDETAIRAHIETLPHKPLLSVIMPVYQTPEKWLRWAIESVRHQLYPHWELCIADDASKAPHVRKVLEKYAALDPRIKVVFRAANGHISESSNSALALATGEFAVLFDHDDELPPHALYLVANAINEHPQADLLYSDEDKIDETGRPYDPYFKPDWNFDLMTAQNCFSHLGVYRLSLVRAIGGFRKGYEGSQDYDLALRCLARTSWSTCRTCSTTGDRSRAPPPPAPTPRITRGARASGPCKIISPRGTRESAPGQDAGPPPTAFAIRFPKIPRSPACSFPPATASTSCAAASRACTRRPATRASRSSSSTTRAGNAARWSISTSWRRATAPASCATRTSSITPQSITWRPAKPTAKCWCCSTTTSR
jgi:hypothetical protein